MAILTETRWQCDFCGHVSPALQHGEKTPLGWVEYHVKPDSNGVRALRPEAHRRHFCTEWHWELWLKGKGKA